MTDKLKRALATTMALMLMVSLAACSGGDGGQTSAGSTTTSGPQVTEKSLNLYICANLVSEDGASAVADRLKALLGEDVAITTVCVSTPAADPSMQMAGIMKLSAAVASGEIDIVIADADNAARNARSDMFSALSDSLSAETVTALGDKALAYAMVNEEGEPTGEMTSACGIDITGAGLADGALATGAECGIFMMSNAPHAETAKSLLDAVAKSLTSSDAG